jgi:hypothetical protein
VRLLRATLRAVTPRGSSRQPSPHAEGWAGREAAAPARRSSAATLSHRVRAGFGRSAVRARPLSGPAGSSSRFWVECSGLGKIAFVLYAEHDLFIPPENLDAAIWRYVDFAKLVALLDTRTLFFSRADLLGDAFEGSYSRASVETFDLEGRDLERANSSAAAELRLASGSSRSVNLVKIPRDRPSKGGRPIIVQLAGKPPASADDYLWPPQAWQFKLELSADRARARVVYVVVEYDGGWVQPGVTLWDIVHVGSPVRRPQPAPVRRDRPPEGFSLEQG